MAWKLWLDDERPAPKNYLHAKNCSEAIHLMNYMQRIKEGWPKHVSFDHDLGLEKTGYDLACYFERMVHYGKMDPDQLTFSVHSANPVGAARIRQAMNKIAKEI